MQHRPKKSGSQSGVAIVIVLGFVVLVTGLILAFFSRSMLDRQVSNSSANQNRVELFAAGAAETILGDLKGEIVAGSSNAGTDAFPVYVPITPSNMVPKLEGSTGANGLENLLKVSGTALSRVGTASTTGTSLNGRYMTAARWNKPLLMPASGTNNYTPPSGFVAPKWILVAKDGSNPGSASSTVVGRYAYAIYNQGGLLDANVAGYPSSAGIQQWGYKSSSAYADLTRIGLTTAQADQLVAWRNYASTQAGDSFRSPGFTADSSTRFHAHVTSNTTGFLLTGTSLYKNQSDRMFVGRQQLIGFLLNGLQLPLNSSALQRLATFSRSLNQPSYAPSANRPKVSGSAYVKNSTVYPSGNTAFTQDDIFNPAFRKIRVQTAFDRNDGTKARVGEPLVKSRFALNRLCWITCEGPSASATPTLRQAYTNQGVSANLLDQGTAKNIENYFGLRWNPGPGINYRGGYWTYVHSNNGNISTLDLLVNAREPDFFELLKASIAAGSIGKGLLGIAPGLSPNPLNSPQYSLFEQSSVDNQIIQIGANIINQSAPDNFPRWIIFSDGTLNRSFWGVVDMPYLYGLISQYILVRQADPPVTAANQSINDSSTSALADGGNAALLQLPIIWNPHAIGPAALGPSPSDLRISVSHNSVASPSLTATTWRSFIKPLYGSAQERNSTTIPVNPSFKSLTPGYIATTWSLGTYDSSTEIIKMPAPGSVQNNILTFSNNGNLYREPTPLMRVNIPAGSNLQADGGHVLKTLQRLDVSGSATGTPYGLNGITEANTNDSFIGFFMGQFPVRWPKVITTTTNGVTTSSTNILSLSSMAAQSGGYGTTYSLEYDAGNGNWVPYQQKILDPSAWTPYTPPYDAVSSGSTAPIASVLSPKGWVAFPGNLNLSLDPRTKRWTSNFDVWRTNLGFLDSAKSIVGSVRPSTGIGSVCHSIWLGGVGKDMFYNTAAAYLSDPDGIVRRPMGAWVGTTGTSGAATTTTGLPTATVWTTSTQTSANAGANIVNRPMILHRPFRNVAELGYAFSDTPWRNLDFFTPESGFAALLDAFCINESGDSNAMVAGKVDLNTRQTDVLAAVLSGALRDELQVNTPVGLSINAPVNPNNSTNEVAALAQALVNRTTDFTTAGNGPLCNIADLVGRYSTGMAYDSTYCNRTIVPVYGGFSRDLALYSGAAASANNLVGRFRETAMRALSDTGQVGTWNLLIDLVAQVGRYPAASQGLDSFLVEGEKRYWLHVAIDRQSGKVIDRQLEVVNE